MTRAEIAPNRPCMTGTTARGRNVRSRDAAHNRKIASSARRGHAVFTVCPDGGGTFAIVVNGRTLCALRQLTVGVHIHGVAVFESQTADRAEVDRLMDTLEREFGVRPNLGIARHEHSDALSALPAKPEQGDEA
jgi:hypothetical protein